jgi:hypothetical protein
MNWRHQPEDGQRHSDSQTGARMICDALGIMRTCFETIAPDRLDERLRRLEDPMAQHGEVAGTAQEPFQ